MDLLVVSHSKHPRPNFVPVSVELLRKVVNQNRDHVPVTAGESIVAQLGGIIDEDAIQQSTIQKGVSSDGHRVRDVDIFQAVVLGQGCEKEEREAECWLGVNFGQPNAAQVASFSPVPPVLAFAPNPSPYLSRRRSGLGGSKW